MPTEFLKTSTKANKRFIRAWFICRKSDQWSGWAKNANFESIKTVEHKYNLIDNEEDAKRLYDYLFTKQILSLDTETTSTHAVDAELVGLSFAVEEKEAFYVPIPSDRKEALKFVNIFKPLYENPKSWKWDKTSSTIMRYWWTMV